MPENKYLQYPGFTNSNHYGILTSQLQYPVLVDDTCTGGKVTVNQPMRVKKRKSLSSVIGKGEPEQPAKVHVWIDQDVMEATSEAVLMHHSCDGTAFNGTTNKGTNILMLDFSGT